MLFNKLISIVFIVRDAVPVAAWIGFLKNTMLELMYCSTGMDQAFVLNYLNRPLRCQHDSCLVLLEETYPLVLSQFPQTRGDRMGFETSKVS